MFPKSTRREVIFLICIKAIALTLIYYVFAAPGARPEPDSVAVTAHILYSGRN
jgi:hypothetical protein